MDHGRIRGTVSRFDQAKGYGFISRDGANARGVFFHQTDLVMDGFRTIAQGEAVEFDLETTERGLHARNVVKVEPSQSVTADDDEWSLK